jgi:hypothetical protein
MGDIKSAREIAMEKIDALGEPTDAERLEWKYLPEGEKLAARYLKGDAKLQEELAKSDKTAAPTIARGVCEVLIKNINLPKDEAAQKVSKIAMDGLKIVKTDKSRLEGILNQIRQIFTHYNTQGEQQRKQAYEVLKDDFQAKVQQALQQQMGSNAANMRIDIEKQPQFQEEWRKVKNQLDGQYIKVLTELKQQLTVLK